MRSSSKLAPAKLLSVLQILLFSFFALCAPSQAQCDGRWMRGDGLPGVSGSVLAMLLWDPDGVGPRDEVVVAGGAFRVAGQAIASNIASWDGVHWNSLGGGVDGLVTSLAISQQGDLIVAGFFGSAGGVSARNIARWNGNEWAAFGQGVDDGSVNAVAVLHTGEIVAGGSFSHVGGVPAKNLAIWNGIGWSELGGGIEGDFVSTMAVMQNGDLVVGGSFSTAGDSPIQNIANWDGLNWSQLGAGVDAQSMIDAVTVVSSGDLLVCGGFDAAGGVPASNIAIWDGETWSPLGDGISGRAYAATLLPDGSIVVGGNLSMAGGSAVTDVARWDGTAWMPMGSGIGFSNRSVFALSTSNEGVVYAGGDFVNVPVSGPTSFGLASWNGEIWMPVTDGSGLDGVVWCVSELPNQDILVGGSFNTAGGVTCNGIAKWNGFSWSTLGVGLGNNSLVVDMEVLPNGNVVVGGSIFTAGETAVNHIALWDGQSWRSLQGGIDNGNGAVLSLAVMPNGNVIAGGSFSMIGGVEANNIAVWNGTAWSSLGSGVDGEVWEATVLSNGDVLVGGDFEYAGGIEARNIAHWNGQSWSALGNGLGGEILALQQMENGDVIAGGFFAIENGYNTARWDGNQWRALGAGTSWRVWDIGLLPTGEVVVAGEFNSAGGQPADNVAIWDGSEWRAMDSGLSVESGHMFSNNGIALGLAVLTNGDIAVGGSFAMAGDSVSAFWARWTFDQITREPIDTSACIGSTISVSVETSHASPMFEWRRERSQGEFVALVDGVTDSGSVVMGANSASLHISNTNASDSGHYQCVVVQGACVQTTRTCTITVESIPDVRTTGAGTFSDSRIGEEVSIVWTSRNEGTSSAQGTWTDRLYLSLDQAFDAADTELGLGFQRSGPLGIGAAYQTIAQVVLPRGIAPGDYYVIVRNDTSNQLIECSGELNNTFVGATRSRVLPPALPNLIVSNITPPNNANPGSIAEVAYTVTNVGDGVVTGSWDETLYGSLDATIGNDLAGLTTRFSATLQPGQAVQRRYNAQVPNVPVGNYWLVVCVDTNNGGEISESDEGNNCGIVPVCFNCNSPNLTITDVTAPSQATAGLSTSVSWTVRNEGLAEAAGTWIDRVELAPTCSDGIRTVLAEFRRSSVLAPGGEYTLARPVVVPPETEGPRRFIVTTDRLNELSEPGGESDNEGCSPSDTQVNLPARPDLIVSNVTPNQSEGVFNQTFSLSWTVRNIGAVATSATWNDRVFISPDAIRNANDFPLEPIRAFVDGPLDPNSELTVQHTVQLPLRASLPAGSYYFIVVTDVGNVVDEQRESNQFAVSGPVQISRPPLPDLQVIASSISANACPGQTVEMVYTVTNAGNEPATGSWIERAFSSPDNQVGNDYFGSQRTVSGPLAPGEQVTRTLNVVVPQEGLSYYGVLCIDPQGTVFESDEANNCALTQSSAVVGRPDLVPEGIQASPQTVLADGNLDISWAVRNSGVCATGSSFLDSVSLVSVDGPQTYLLGSGVHPSLIAPSQLDPLSRTFAVPGRIAGDFRVQVRADSAANVLEPDEVNNVALSAGVVSVSQPPRADIFVVPGTIELPADGLVSSVGVVHYTLVNLGAADAVGPWTDRIVARRSGSEPGPDIDLGSLPFTGSVGNGEMLTRTANITLPTLPGDYIVCVIVDSGDLLNEGLAGGEDNNRECSIDSFNADGYRVVTVPSLSEALSGTPVSISGYAESLSTNQRLADVPVWINYNVRSFNRPIRVRTDVNGDFGIASQIPVLLLPTEAGRYRVTAGPPNAIVATPESSFVLHGLRATPEFTGLRVAPGFKGETLQLEVFNAGDVTLTGLNASIVGAPSGLLVDLQLNGEPVGGQSITGQQIVRPVVQLTAPPGTQFYDGPITITWSTDQGAAATTILRVRVAPRDPAITAIPPTIETGIVTSTIDEPQQTTVQFTLTNTGGLPTGAINVLLPAEVLCDGVPEPTAPWMTLSTPATLPSLNPDDTSSVVIVLAPSIQQPLCAFVGQLEVRFDSGTRSTIIPFQLTHRSNAVGNVTVAAANEGTYWAPNHPPLENALVTIRDARTNQVFGTQITGEDGLAHFEDLPEGTYYAEAARDQHLPYRNIVNVRREETAQVDAFLPFQAVTYSWTVDPIQVEDRYRFVLDATFVTNVYVPTLDITVIDPDTGTTSRVLDLDDVAGEKQFLLRIENKGLVDAEEVVIQVTNDSGWNIDFLTSFFAPVRPGSANALSVPFTVRSPAGRSSGQVCRLPVVNIRHRITCNGFRFYVTSLYTRLTTHCPESPFGCCVGGSGTPAGPNGGPANPYGSPPTPPIVPNRCTSDDCEFAKNCLNDKCASNQANATSALWCQLACIANKCEVDSPDWIKTTHAFTAKNKCGNNDIFERICQNINLTYLDTTIGPGAGDFCMFLSGNEHMIRDLIPAWYYAGRKDHCQSPPIIEHNLFLFLDLVPCMLQNDKLSPYGRIGGAVIVPILANFSREWARFLCLVTETLLEQPTPPELPDASVFQDISNDPSQLVVNIDPPGYIREGQDFHVRVFKRLASGAFQEVTLESDLRMVFVNRYGTANINPLDTTVAIRDDNPLAEYPSLGFVAATFQGQSGMRAIPVLGLDSDLDGITDSAESANGLDAAVSNSFAEDRDGDGLINIVELLIGTNPIAFDTDGDGVGDGIAFMNTRLR